MIVESHELSVGFVKCTSTHLTILHLLARLLISCHILDRHPIKLQYVLRDPDQCATPGRCLPHRTAAADQEPWPVARGRQVEATECRAAAANLGS
jgi:hypothetical protein